MAYNSPPAMTNRGPYVSYGGVAIDNPENLSAVTPGGEAPDIPLTNLHSPRAEFAQGLVDGGTITGTIIIDPTGPLHTTLKDANLNGTSAELRVLQGYTAPGVRVTSGAGWELNSLASGTGGVSVNAPGSGDPWEWTIPAALVSSLNPISVGHYLTYLTGAAPGTATSVRITEVAAPNSAGAIVVKAGTGNSAPTLTTGSVVTTTRPSWEIRQTARVMRYVFQDFVADNAVKVDVSFRSTGAATDATGTPNLTI